LNPQVKAEMPGRLSCAHSNRRNGRFSLGHKTNSKRLKPIENALDQSLGVKYCVNVNQALNGKKITLSL
jgi:hypothetical protein